MVKDEKTIRKRRLKILTVIIFTVVFLSLMAFLLTGKNQEIIRGLFGQGSVTTDDLRKAIAEMGFISYFTVAILSMLQVILTFLPAEPVQVLSGICFGFVNGGLLCLAGVVVGNTILYLLYRVFGERMTDFLEVKHYPELKKLVQSRRMWILILLLYLLPAIPYGLICILAASVNDRFGRYIFVTTLGSIPTVAIGVVLGSMAATTSWIFTVIVFVLLIALLIVLYKKKDVLLAKLGDMVKKSENSLQKVNKPFLNLLAFGTKVLFDGKNKVTFKNRVGRLERPSIVLCNHGSALDFIYAGRMLRKEAPHFVSARLYFYERFLGSCMRSVGCLPKSMFTSDLENAKSCLRVLGNNEILAMMPEARLSSVGKFEGIQDSTYNFIRRSNVTVYALHINGAFLAKPKWGDKVRRGGKIEVELTKLFDAGEPKKLSLNELKQRINAALDYNELEWLAVHPEISYPSRTLAVGLENVLYRCPRCGAIGKIHTHKRTVGCDCCDFNVEIDSRYTFTEAKPFSNFAEWYAWQNEVTKAEILANPDFKLESKVELRHSSTDGRTQTRHAGEGVCTLDRTGLRYVGTRDGETVEKFFPLESIFRLLFGAGINFEIYEGKEIWFFVPENKRTCVMWYVISGILKEEAGEVL